MNTLVRSSAFLISMMVANIGSAVSIHPITGSDGLGRVDLKNFKVNASGDFVATSNSKVFVGNVNKDELKEILYDQNSSFVLNPYATFNDSNRTYTVDAEFYHTRLGINQSGDFIVTTRKQLYVGNARTQVIKKVGVGANFTELQMVAINDAGQYTAISDEQVWVGNVVEESATSLLNDPVGNFSIYGLYVGGTIINVSGVETRLAMNGKGQFLVITNSALYAGDVAAKKIELVHEERWIGYKYVTLADDGVFLVSTDNQVFTGNVNN